MHLPSTMFETRLRTDPEVRTLWMRGVFSGFELRLDTNLVDYARLFQKVYRQGRISIEQLVEDYPIDAPLASTAKEPESPTVGPRRPLAVRTSLDFYSGRVCLYPVVEMDVPEMADSPLRSKLLPLDRAKRSLSTADVIVLPGISAWVEYRHRPGTDSGDELLISSVRAAGEERWSVEFRVLICRILNRSSTRARTPCDQA
jgi:hypothetical protein